MADVERVDPVDASDELSYPSYRSQERIVSNMTFELRGKCKQYFDSTYILLGIATFLGYSS